MQTSFRVLAGFAAGLLLAASASAQTNTSGRRAFVKQKCLQCHYFEARSIAPTVKEMRQTYKGAPSKVLSQISGNAGHGEVKTPPAESARAMAIWIADASFEEESGTGAKPGSPEAKRQAAQKAKDEREAKAREAADAKAQARRDAEEKARAAKAKALTEEKPDPAAIARARAEAAAFAKSIQEAVARAQATQAAAEKERKDAEAAVKAKLDAADKAREADAKEQARRDAAARAQAQKEQEELARREAEAKAKKDTAALEAIRKENEARAKREAELAAQQKREAEARAKRDAEERARLEAELKARQEAEARAKREAELAAQQKRDAEARAKQEAEAKARQEAEAKARRDAELAVQQKREAEARAKQEAEARAQAQKKPEPVASAATEEAPKPGGRKKKRGYSDGSNLPPCPKPTGAPMPPLDESAAKAIIERIGCAQCHAYVQKKTGPPMKRIYEKYKNDWECVVSRLTQNDTHKEEGVTGDLKGNEPKTVGAYIATRDK